MNANDSVGRSMLRLARAGRLAILGGALLGLGAWRVGALASPRSEAIALQVQTDAAKGFTSGQPAPSPGAVLTPSGPNR